MTLISHTQKSKTPVIGNYSITDGTTGDDLTFISKMLNWALFSGPAIVFFSIFIMVLINKTLVKEINNSQITCWVTLPFSRKQILLSKTLYIIFSNFIVFLPSYLLVLIFASISYDASQWLGHVVLYGLQFILFIVLLTMIYILVSIILIEKTVILNIVNSLVAFWILATWTMLLIYDMDPIQNEGLKYMQYISLFFAIFNCLPN